MPTNDINCDDTVCRYKRRAAYLYIHREKNTPQHSKKRFVILFNINMTIE